MKKVLSVILCAAIILSLTGCNKQAENDSNNSEQASESIYESSENDFEYEDIEGGIKITKYVGKGGNITIPEEINGKSVVGINAHALDEFAGGIISVRVPKCLTELNGFYPSVNCDLSNFTSIDVDEDNPKYCSIDGMLFEKKGNDELYFMLCPAGKSGEIVFSEKVTDINLWGFEYCTKLTGISVSEGNPKYCSFDGMLCKKESGKIKMLMCPLDLSGKITVPDGVTEIDSSIFANCGKITSITIPQSVTSISRDAFKDCEYLEEIIVAENNPSYYSHDGALYERSTIEHYLAGEQPCYVLFYVPQGKKGNMEIAAPLSEFDGSLLDDCKNITSFSGESMIMYAMNHQMHYYTKDGMLFQGLSGFYNLVRCAPGKTGDVVVSSEYNLVAIGDGAFKNCVNLKSVRIPENLETKDSMFEGCPNLKIIHGDPETNDGFKYKIDENGALITKYIGKSTNVEIPETIEGKKVYRIEASAFEGRGDIKKLVIADSVTEIAYGTFDDCSGLTGIVFGKGITRVGHEHLGINLNDIMLGGCKSLESVVFTDSLTQIEDDVFSGCKNLKSVTLGNKLQSIGNFAFSGCSSLANIDIPKSVTYIASTAFENSAWLENKRKENPLVIINGILYDGKTCSGKVTIPNGITKITNEAFAKSNVTDVTIPNGVKEIGSGVFMDCNNLKTVKLPDSVTYIECYMETNCLPAFYGSDNVKITYKGKTYTQSNIKDLYNLFGTVYW